MLLGRRAPAHLPGEQGDGEHAEGQGGEGQARAHGAVLQHHLEVDRQGDHGAAEGDLLEQLPRDAQSEDARPEEPGVDERRPALALATDQPGDEAGHGHRTDHEEGTYGLGALLPGEDPEDDAAHAEHREGGADPVHGA